MDEIIYVDLFDTKDIFYRKNNDVPLVITSTSMSRFYMQISSHSPPRIPERFHCIYY